MKWLVFCVILLSSPLVWAEGFKLSDLQLGYSYPNTEVKVLDYSQKLKFNQYIFKINFSHTAISNYFVGLETNVFKNKSSLSYEQFLLVIGKKFHVHEKWQLVGEMKLGWGLMHDQGDLYKTEGYSGLVLGVSGGVLYSLDPVWSVGSNINYLRQVHGQGLSNNHHSSQSYLFQSLAPSFLIIYNF